MSGPEDKQFNVIEGHRPYGVEDDWSVFRSPDVIAAILSGENKEVIAALIAYARDNQGEIESVEE